MGDPLAEALSRLVSVLTQLEIRYAIVGSLASSARGLQRATADVDLLARLGASQAEGLAAALGKDWYVDSEMAARSVRSGRGFNVIHIPTAQKFDVFPATNEFQSGELDRASVIAVRLEETDLQLPVASAEDIVLAKLSWYRQGGEVSERQWNDVAGLLSRNPDLDQPYLRYWADRLHIADLLEKALAASD